MYDEERKPALLNHLLVSGRSPLYRFLPRRGPLALIRLFGPYLFSLLMLVFVRARWRHWLLLRPLLLSVVAGNVAQLARRRSDGRPTPGARTFSVMSWNILFERLQSDAMIRFLATGPADVVALQESTADHVRELSTEQALFHMYPHRIIWGYGYGAGMGLLSRYPILEQGRLDVPPLLWARLDLGAGQSIVLVSAHPTFAPTKMEREVSTPKHSIIKKAIGLLDLRFLWYDPDYRDEGIARIRAAVEPLLRQGEALLLVGDFNVTERERAYRDLSAGLQDVFLAVGSGGGNTWRPKWLVGLPLPILRIDYMFSSPGLRPLRMWVDRTPRGSDHCAIHGVFELARSG